MVEQHIALVPTVKQLERFPDYAAAGEARFPAYAARMRDLHERRRETLRSAYEAGVAIYAGTDAGGVLPHGLIGDEVLALAELGLSPGDALAPRPGGHARGWGARVETSTRATRPTSSSTTRTRCVDLAVLKHPRRIVLRGRVVLTR